MTDTECKAGPFYEETGQIGNDACDSSQDGIVEDVRKKSRKDARNREAQLELLGKALKQNDATKLLEVFEDVVRRVLLEERVQTKIAVYR